MQFISRINGCLLFKYKEKRCLYGLSQQLQDNEKTLAKMDLTWVVIPTYAYNIELSSFLWNFKVLKKIKFQQIVVSDINTKKHIQSIINTNQSIIPSNKWNFFKQLQLKEQQIIEMLLTIRDISPQKKFHPKFNCKNQVTVIVNSKGRSIILMYQCETILIDPASNIEQLYQQLHIPFNSIKAVILCKRTTNFNVFQLFMKFNKIPVICSYQNYDELMKDYHKYFNLPFKILQSKLKGKIIDDQTANRMHIFHFLEIGFFEQTHSKQKSGKFDFWQIKFDKKIIRIYPEELTHYPKQLSENQNLQYLFALEIQQKNRKLLKSIPQLYRKKIIFNKPNKKYDNKYFYTLNEINNFVTIELLKNHKEPFSSSLHLKHLHNDSNFILIEKKMKNGQVFNSHERVVFITNGYAKNENGASFSYGEKIMNSHTLTCINNTTILYQAKKFISFHENWKDSKYHQEKQKQNYLKRVSKNTFIENLKKERYLSYNQIADAQKFQISEDEEIIQKDSEWHLLNSICNLKTYQNGCQINKSNSYVYFIVKGALKFKNEEQIASKQMFIGNIKLHFSKFNEELSQIQVLKDSWVLQILYKDLQKIFFRKFPQKAYQLLTKAYIFD